MGEAKRRAEILAEVRKAEAEHVAKHGPLTDWQKEMGEVYAQGRVGIGFAMMIVKMADLRSVPVETDDGRLFVETAVKWRRQVLEGRKPLCMFCDHEFLTPHTVGAFMCLIPVNDDPKRTLGSGICKDCAKRDYADLAQAGFQAMVKLGLANKEIGLMRPGHG